MPFRETVLPVFVGSLVVLAACATSDPTMPFTTHPSPDRPTVQYSDINLRAVFTRVEADIVDDEDEQKRRPFSEALKAPAETAEFPHPGAAAARRIHP